MDKFGELRVDVGWQFVSGGVAADDDFCVDLNEVRLHAPAATCSTVARGTDTTRLERDCNTTANPIGTWETVVGADVPK